MIDETIKVSKNPSRGGGKRCLDPLFRHSNRGKASVCYYVRIRLK
jgi:hypothetical protein